MDHRVVKMLNRIRCPKEQDRWAINMDVHDILNQKKARLQKQEIEGYAAFLRLSQFSDLESIDKTNDCVVKGKVL